MLKLLKNHGFASIVEVIITAVIFTLTIFAVFSSITGVIPISKESFDTLGLHYYSEGMMQSLTSQVNVPEWLNGTLITNVAHSENQEIHGDVYPFSYQQFKSNYIITDVSGYAPNEGPRKVTLNMSITPVVVPF